MKVTITEKHLNRAIRARLGKIRDSIVRTCLIGQVCREIYPEFEACFEGGINVRNCKISLRVPKSSKINEFIYLFDKHDYAEIRKQLPVTVRFPDVPK